MDVKRKNKNNHSDFLHWVPIPNCLAFITISYWLMSDCQEVHCIFQRSSMELKNCSDFLLEDFPQITITYNDQEFSSTFAIDEQSVLDHEIFYFKCVAKYPIEWISNDHSSTVL